ncbi:heme-binding protein [Pseudomonas sp. R5(2019)]|uniref:GlcG/HbpS family heme-binding protein n=1 Tax=Pseudomonas sp. R5(2019) TaxID=2697566 RepID=UPI001411FBAA|nr:heme-binding protein [Pseudomonas sp. R5(2019)]NBA97132.1 heme-binding protein [Pseudomonas sp. R5(2019)]
MNGLLRQQPQITLVLATLASQAAQQLAQSLNVSVSISVVDAAGQLIHLSHMDNAPNQSRDIALSKARTAAGFKVSTGAWDERLSKCSPGVQQGLPLQANLALFGGGEPFFWEGTLIGAIGISGASEKVDSDCAAAARDRVAELLAAS